ncbi:MAG: polymer-forming cytoskeletal protein, partial [Anaerolineales bacterium]
KRVEILASGRLWGDVVTTAFSTEEGAFMRGQITMEDQLDLGFSAPAPDVGDAELEPSEN